MGIDIHNLHFLAYAQDRGARFDRTVAIGRQALFVEDWELEAHRRARRLAPLAAPAPGAPRYFEPLLREWLGARDVESVDASPYEGASLVHDMNLPWPTPLDAARQFDAVLDFGCLEHVFDFPQAWRNCAALCRVGGHVLHALPANNLAGHGFYQFSPELFFNLYRPGRGFELVDLFFALRAERRYWWRVANPLQVKRRVNLRNSHEVYMLVLARKLGEAAETAPPPQQSDYANDEWLQAAPPAWASDSQASMTCGAPGMVSPRGRSMRPRRRGCSRAPAGPGRFARAHAGVRARRAACHASRGPPAHARPREAVHGPKRLPPRATSATRPAHSPTVAAAAARRARAACGPARACRPRGCCRG
jgi:SAM-dependent methyltransferase